MKSKKVLFLLLPIAVIVVAATIWWFRPLTTWLEIDKDTEISVIAIYTDDVLGDNNVEIDFRTDDSDKITQILEELYSYNCRYEGGYTDITDVYDAENQMVRLFMQGVKNGERVTFSVDVLENGTVFLPFRKFGIYLDEVVVGGTLLHTSGNKLYDYLIDFIPIPEHDTTTAYNN